VQSKARTRYRVLAFQWSGLKRQDAILRGCNTPGRDVTWLFSGQDNWPLKRHVLKVGSTLTLRGVFSKDKPSKMQRRTITNVREATLHTDTHEPTHSRTHTRQRTTDHSEDRSSKTQRRTITNVSEAALHTDTHEQTRARTHTRLIYVYACDIETITNVRALMGWLWLAGSVTL